MKIVMGALVIGLLGLGYMHYGQHLTHVLESFESTHATTRDSLDARDRMMADLDARPVPEPKFEDISLKPDTNHDIKLPRFLSESGKVMDQRGARSGTETGNVTLHDVSKDKCLELADKWMGRIVINDRPHANPSTLCRGRNKVVYSM